MTVDITNTTADAVDIDAPVEIADKPREPSPYERKLRAETAKWRSVAREAEQARDVAIAAAKADADQRISETTKQYRERLMRADLKAHAVKAGILDIDALKLMDISKVQMTEDGEVANADIAVEEFKKSKPHFFGAISTSSTSVAPKPASSEAKSAMKMSEDEYKAALAEMGVR